MTFDDVKRILRKMGEWGLTLALAYVTFVGALFVMQRELIYFPVHERFRPAEWNLSELGMLTAQTVDGLTLTSWFSPPRTRDKLTIVYFQGNAGSLGTRAAKFRPWIDKGYGLLLVGYRGFGNPGLPNEEGLYSDAQAAIDALRVKGFSDSGMVFYGESLGTGVAVQMATEYAPAAVILEAPYTSLADVGADRYPLLPVRWLLRDKFDSLSKIENVAAPLLVLHGLSDTVVPPRFGKEIFEKAKSTKQAFFAPGAGHSLTFDLASMTAVENFIEKLPTDHLVSMKRARGQR